MNACDDDGPAFPVPADRVFRGMTLRDYFAAKALQGLLSAGRHAQYGNGDMPSEALACYEFADAMLKARKA